MLNRANERKTRIAGRKGQSLSKAVDKGAMVMWFRDEIEEDKPQFTEDEVCQLIDRFVHRHEAELEELQALSRERKMRVKPNRQDQLEHALQLEQALFRSGFEAPDLTKPKNVARLREWNGELRFLQNIEMRKFKAPADGVAVPSSDATAADDVDVEMQ
eukprot:m.258124 g.258124  ORF g.258124 m.258124 type:complete len:159 (+) comp11033_c1_seq24:2915-3391(+)